MANFKQLPYVAQIGLVALVILLLAAGAYWYALVPLDKANQADALILRTKQAEIAQLAPFKAKLAQLTAQTADLKAKMQAQNKIVPEEKDVPSLITDVERQSVAAGIEVRRYTPKATVAKQYFTEVPFEIDVDGPFFSVVNFFDRMRKLNRIVSVNHLTMGALKNGGRSAVRTSYRWAPDETVAANCLLTTYYSNPKAAAPPAPAKRVKR